MKANASTILALMIIFLMPMLTALSSVTYVQAEALGSWTHTSYYPTDIELQSCVVYSGYIYCVGGASLSKTWGDAVYYASISSTGVGTWTNTTAYPIGVNSHSCVAYSGYIYCVGGWTGSSPYESDAVYYASISSTGVGTWTNTTAYPTPISEESCATYSGYIYCVGGAGYAVYYASISSTGVGTWKSTTAYPTPIYFVSCATYLGYIYCVGGNTGPIFTDAVYSAPVGSGGVGTWTLSTNAYPTNIVYESCVVYSGYIYCVGGDTGNSPYESDAVYYAPVSSGGVGTWKSTKVYPTNIIYESCVAYSGYVYCVGGGALAPLFDVYYAAILTSVSDLNGFTGNSTGSILIVLGDFSIYPHGTKRSGVGFQSGRDTTPVGAIFGMLSNSQIIVFDTNTAYVDSSSGRPLAGSYGTIFVVGGPLINAASYYYQHTSVAGDKAPVSFSTVGSNSVWTDKNGTQVLTVPQSSDAVPPGNSDVFTIEVFKDSGNRTVALMFGTTFVGTWAASYYFKYILYPNISTYTNGYYLIRWTDATTGPSANGVPDTGDTWSILATSPS